MNEAQLTKTFDDLMMAVVTNTLDESQQAYIVELLQDQLKIELQCLLMTSSG